MLPVVAIVGRPNVGKSSLFNRLLGKRLAIESPVSGTTRDQISQRMELANQDILLIDTGGLSVGVNEDIESDVQTQANTAIHGADLILFVLDAKNDPTVDDFHAAELLRKSGKPCLMIANKCDDLSRLEQGAFNFYELGFGEPIAVSAIHGTGIDHLESEMDSNLTHLGFKRQEEEDRPQGALRITFIGRPNVGKSSLINSLFGKKKVIVSDIPGTTRDSIEVPFSYEEKSFVLVDTAGVRRRGKVEQGIEKYSVMRSFQAIEDSDIVILVLDGSDGVRAQDLHVCEFVLQQHKGMIIAVNKIDLFDEFEAERRQFENILRHRMAFTPWASVVFVSALERRNLFKLLDLSLEIGAERRRMVDEKELQFWLKDTVLKHIPAGSRGLRQAEVVSVFQKPGNFPCFIFKVHHPQFLHFSYKRYLENQLREKFGFSGTSVKMIFDNVSTRGPRGPKAKRGHTAKKAPRSQ
ncbi:MAG: hypothetical protein ACD_28C00178G0005 [uncultured bacterium]|nr:MAG: hypothetical protein ACD_28C00178G0005 [uncultured bacterium]